MLSLPCSPPSLLLLLAASPLRSGGPTKSKSGTIAKLKGPTCGPDSPVTLGQRHPSGGATWNISILNTGHTAGIFTEIYHALVSERDYAAGRFRYTRVTDRGEIIPPARPGEEAPSGVTVTVPTATMISCGYIVYTDVYRDRHEQAWKHRLHAVGASEPLPRCYSDPPDKNH